jgi:hypothetical protein
MNRTVGLNTGVFYVRNTEWSRKMFRQVADLGTGNGKDYEMKFRSHLSVYDWALFDQNGFTYWLKTTADESSSHVYLESDYDINSYWKDMPISKLQAKLDSDSISGGEMFIKHFMGCQFCSGINAIEAEKCEKDFLDSWRFANDRLERSTFRQ